VVGCLAGDPGPRIGQPRPKRLDSRCAEALQRAQLALLEQKRFDHPFFWSPFLTINNWL
jgi:hypothetical protein